MKKCCHFESALITEKSPQTPKTPWSFIRAHALSGVNCSPVAEKRQAHGCQMQTPHEKSDAFRDLTSGKLRVFDILATWGESPMQVTRSRCEPPMRKFQKMRAANSD